MIPVARPVLGAEETAALAEVIASGWVAQGPRVAEFERRFAETVGAEHAVAVSSCTTALHLALLLAGVGAGDEVVVPSLSFIATANAVRYVGATPVFADVEVDTLNLGGDDRTCHHAADGGGDPGAPGRYAGRRRRRRRPVPPEGHPGRRGCGLRHRLHLTGAGRWAAGALAAFSFHLARSSPPARVGC
ncbi:MAG: aminotransferase class I/II-fold pyridoxal phosphate-dependent enzyme [Acidimicrobiales bacterium]